MNDPRDLTITNQGSETQVYNVTVVATFTPDCRFEEPACGKPDYRAVVLQRTGDLRPGDSETFADLVARHGTYDVIVTATPPGPGGDHVRETGSWHVFNNRGDAVVTIEDESVTVS